MNTQGLTKEEYIGALKHCGMCTKKWTRSKLKDFDRVKKEIINSRKKKLFKKK